MLGLCGNVASAPFIKLSRIFYSGHACPNLNLVIITPLNAQYKIKEKTSTIVYRHVDILWTYQGAKTKNIISAWLCRFKWLQDRMFSVE